MIYGAPNASTKPANLTSQVLQQAIADGRLGDLVGRHSRMQKLFEDIATYAPTTANVLITGETGVGKELVAHAIHDFSPRRNKPFVILDCSTLSKELLESELFGHEKGSFTGADRLHLGRFERANGGTLFLDEISNMNLEIQAKLLRVLQARTIERIGGNKEIRVDVRVVAASNRSLPDCVDEGTFRDDLYHRLYTGLIELPPLRERATDIPLIAEKFLAQFKTQYLKEIRGFTTAALDALQKFSWPGNVRELRNLVERTVIRCKGDLIDISDLPEHLTNPNLPSEESRTVRVRRRVSVSDHTPGSSNPVPAPQAAASVHPAVPVSVNSAPFNEPVPPVATYLPPAQTPHETLVHRPPPGPARETVVHRPPPGPSPGFSVADLDLDPAAAPRNGRASRLAQEIAAFERRFILKTLEDHRGNVLKTARYLGISRTALYKKLERYRIKVAPYRA